MSCRTTFPTKNVPKGTWPNVAGASIVLPAPTISSNFREQNRFTLRRAWSRRADSAHVQNQRKPAIGGFRLVNNAGDYLSRVNYSSGGPNMISKPAGIAVLTTKDGGQLNHPDGTGIPASTCNPRYVYDSSDFTVYKRQKAINYGYSGLGKNANSDYSAGGANNGANVSLAFVRRS
jgi:hypothetical protein